MFVVLVNLIIHVLVPIGFVEDLEIHIWLVVFYTVPRDSPMLPKSYPHSYIYYCLAICDTLTVENNNEFLC